MRLLCAVCPNTFISKKTLKVHLKNAHQISPEKKEHVYKCGQCDQRFRNLTEVNSHRERDHQAETTHLCVYCLKLFGSGDELFHHLKEDHGFPDISGKYRTPATTKAPEETSLDGCFKVYRFESVDECDVDLLQFMVERKSTI
jgi:uncharacterized Zn-finger protein